MAVIETANIVKLLKRTYLFFTIDDGLLQEIAESFDVLYFSEGGRVYNVGDDADYFYLVYRGQVAVTPRNARRPNAWLVRGDFFGHEAIVKKRFRRQQVIAEPGTVLLALPARYFLHLYQGSLHIKKSIQQRINTARLMREMKFNWLHDKETVYLLATKHVFFLWQSLVLPLLAMFFGALLVFLFVLTESYIPLVVGIIFVLTGLGWAVWTWIDWGNDFYIITSQRIVWIEKVLFIYDSRMESPFEMIKNADSKTDFIGRMFNYGDVTIKTYTTKIVFSRIPSPNQVSALLQDMMTRSAEAQRKQEEETMTEAIKRELGLIEPPRQVPDEEKPIATPERLTLPLIVLSSLFQLRSVQGDAIVYRKHWFILLREAWQPTLAIVLLTILMIVDLVYNTSENGRLTYFVISLVFWLVAVGWWTWEFVDWSNDRFELTAEQIVDVDKKPIGDENRKTAKLEDILSIEYQREGLAGMILNFGTVFIRVGTETFTFDHVANPSGVQQEIEKYRQARIRQNMENQVKGERERMAKWMAIYHKSAQEIAALEREKGDKLP